MSPAPAADAPPPLAAASPEVLTRSQMRARRPKVRPTFWRRKLVWTGLLVLVLFLTAVGLAWARLATFSPRSTVRLALPALPKLNSAPNLPWPSSGEAAFSVPAFGLSAATPTQSVVPIASLTKMMTAYVVLSDYPLADGADGPKLTLTIADGVATFGDAANDASFIPVQVGEVLTERQLLQGLLVHSANNFADLLAVFDAGSVDNFVAKMNYTASVLGLHQTTFADPSGLSSQSISTPTDLLQLAEDAMKIPAFAETVSMPSVSLPVGGTFASFTPLLAGSPGGVANVVGVKSGFTSVAGGNDVMAYRTTVNGQPVMIFVVVTGQGGSDPLSAAGKSAVGLARAIAGDLRTVQLARQGTRVGQVAVRGESVPVVEGKSVTFVDWPGWQLQRTVVPLKRPLAGSPAVPVGRATFMLGPQRATVDLQMVSPLPVPSLVQRIFGSTG